MIRPGGTGFAIFTVRLGGADIAPPRDLRPQYTVLRNGRKTTILAIETALSVLSAQIIVSFTVPANATRDDRFHILMTGQSFGEPISCTKEVGYVVDLHIEKTTDRIADLLEADQIIEDGFLIYRQAGTQIELMRKKITGSTCADSVALEKP